MIFSKSTEYSIKILLYMSERNSTYFQSAGEIANAVNLPKEYTSKILQYLTHGKIVASKKGKGGGFKLLLNSSDILLGDIVSIFETSGILSRCLIGLNENCDNCECQIHFEWQELKNKIYKSKISEVSKSGVFYN